VKKDTSLLLISATLLIVASFSYLYEQRYTDLIPVITYPYRDYALPLAVLGAFTLVFTLYLRLREKETFYPAFSSPISNLVFFIVMGIIMKVAAEILHEVGGHGFYVLLFGGRILKVHISLLWPLQFSYIWWSLPAGNPLETALVFGGGILNSIIISFVLQFLLFFRPQRWRLGVPLLWLAYWSYISSAGYLLSGGFSAFGDVRELIRMGFLTNLSSFLLGLAVFIAGYPFLSLILRRLLTPLVAVNNLKYAVAAFWLTTALVAILTALNPDIRTPFIVIPMGLIPSPLWLVSELLWKRI